MYQFKIFGDFLINYSEGSRYHFTLWVIDWSKLTHSLVGIKVRKTLRTKRREWMHTVNYILFTYTYWYYLTINDNSIELHLSGDAIVSYINWLNLYITYLIYLVHCIPPFYISAFLSPKCVSERLTCISYCCQSKTSHGGYIVSVKNCDLSNIQNTYVCISIFSDLQ